MALPIHSSSPYPYNLPSRSLFHLPPKARFLVKSQTSSSEASGPGVNGAPAKKPTSSGVGFGPSSANPVTEKKKKKQRQKSSRGERESVIRRAPVDKRDVLSGKQGSESAEKRRNESVFILAWLGLGSAILIEGIVLAASGFLPEALDKFFTKYLYPTFSPTVILFLAGGVAYGVLKYAQNEKLDEKK